MVFDLILQSVLVLFKIPKQNEGVQLYQIPEFHELGRLRFGFNQQHAKRATCSNELRMELYTARVILCLGFDYSRAAIWTKITNHKVEVKKCVRLRG